jgi:hypothetical protein
MTDAKKRVFVSFDFDNDLALKNLLIGQARNPDSPFEVADFSLKETQPEHEWLQKARQAITRSDVFIVLLGTKTHRASGVRKEVKIANELGKARFQLKLQDTNPEPVEDAGRVYNWTWDNLKVRVS